MGGFCTVATRPSGFGRPAARARTARSSVSRRRPGRSPDRPRTATSCCSRPGTRRCAHASLFVPSSLRWHQGAVLFRGLRHGPFMVARAAPAVAVFSATARILHRRPPPAQPHPRMGALMESHPLHHPVAPTTHAPELPTGDVEACRRPARSLKLIGLRRKVKTLEASCYGARHSGSVSCGHLGLHRHRIVAFPRSWETSWHE